MCINTVERKNRGIFKHANSSESKNHEGEFTVGALFLESDAHYACKLNARM